MPAPKPNFAVACPGRSVCDHYAKVFATTGRLQGHYLGKRKGLQEIPRDLFHGLPLVAPVAFASAKLIPRWKEDARVACFPLFDRWVSSRLPERTHLLSSFGYMVRGFRKTRETGGFTLLDAGNSHPEHYWSVVSEEHARWEESVAPYPLQWHKRALATLPLTDWVFCPSSYVRNSFLAHGFPAERLLMLPYPLDLSHFSPDPPVSKPASPLRVICTGSVSLRKGFPYLLEAMRLIRMERDAVLLLTEGIHPSMRKLLDRYQDVPIDWAPSLPHDKLGARLKSAHVFALLSLEDGFALTAAEAMACGIPIVLTPNTGFADFVEPGVNGEIVPIRDAAAAAEAIVRCHERQMAGHEFLNDSLKESLSFARFTSTLLGHIEIIDRAWEHHAE